MSLKTVYLNKIYSNHMLDRVASGKLVGYDDSIPAKTRLGHQQCSVNNITIR